MGNTLDVISKFASRFNRGLSGHTISSPLGLWLLLALTAEDAEHLSEQTTDELEYLLGEPLPSALTRAKRILANPPKSLRAGVALWTEQDIADGTKFADWTKRISEVATVENRIPTQGELDTWARENTLDVIKQFPLQVSPGVISILASAVATCVTWEEPLQIRRARGNMAEWGVENIMEASYLHSVGAFTDGINRFGIHIATSVDGLSVYSVIAEDPSLPPEEVIAAAYGFLQRKMEQLKLDGSDPRVAAGDGIFSLRKTDSTEPMTAFLPAWDAEAELDLLKTPSSGADVLLKALGEHGAQQGDAAVKQVSKARYHNRGFEAASVTAVFLARGMAMPPGREQVVISFKHPYAVLAVADMEDGEDIPAFNAWIMQASEACD